MPYAAHSRLDNAGRAKTAGMSCQAWEDAPYAVRTRVDPVAERGWNHRPNIPGIRAASSSLDLGAAIGGAWRFASTFISFYRQWARSIDSRIRVGPMLRINGTRRSANRLPPFSPESSRRHPACGWGSSGTVQCEPGSGIYLRYGVLFQFYQRVLW